MNFSRLSTSVLWLLPLAMLVVIAFVIWRRGLVGRFPLFFSYTLLLPARDAALYFLPHNQGTAIQVSIGGEKASQFCCPWAWFSNWSGILSGRIRS
jgi:hypothetical protein